MSFLGDKIVLKLERSGGYKTIWTATELYV